MKTISFLTGILLLLFFVVSAGNQGVNMDNSTSPQGGLSISSSPDLYVLTSTWANEFNRLNPEMSIKVKQTAYHNLDLTSGTNLGFISNTSREAFKDEVGWRMVVGRDIIVPVINAGNPYAKELMQKGVSQQKFAQVFNNPDKQNWSTLLSDGQNSPLHIYLSKDKTVETAVARFLKSALVPSHGIQVLPKDKFVEALQSDPYAIGFCKLVDIPGVDNPDLTGKLLLLPIDKNGNGTIDYMEDIYSDANTLLRGVWIGKYPKTLYSSIYAVSKIQPASETEIAFLSWVLTDGQQFMNSNGYCDLISSESQSQLEKFSTPLLNIQPEDKTSNAGLILVLIAAMVLILGVIISSLVRQYRKQATVIPDLNDPLPNFDESSVIVPEGLYYDRSHTWAFMEKDGSVTIGIDDFLQHITGPITRVEMKKAGEKFKKGDLLFSIIQVGKQLNLYAPVSGTIKKQNELLASDSSSMNSSPYIDGWVYKIEPASWIQEIQLLDMAGKYKRWINTEFSRVKDFLAAELKPDSIQYTHVVLQDGGILKDGVLADFGPEVWEDFQTNFLDNYK